ncbi:MAG: hypothetical protein KDK04_25850 [Candidatus Competibacteraceae bacterium]|nr:hypothetical protein [Candidatus Competibacteraceae bacterium]
MLDSSKMNLPDSLTKTISNSELVSVSGELGEVAIDSILENGLLKDIPIISTITGLWKTGASIKDALFTRKLLVFLSTISDIPVEKREGMLESLDDPRTSEKTGEKLLVLLERLESSEKAKLLAKTFKVYVKGIISREEFWRVSYIIDNLPFSDIFALKEWNNEDLNNIEHVRKHLYLNVGLGWFVVNASSTGFQWQQSLCTIFSDHLLDTELDNA